MRIGGSVAIVTGASSGIGAAVAIDLARRGARVVAVARRADRLAETVAACESAGSEAIAHAADVSSRSACDGVVAAANDRFGPVDILVNNAGISLRRHAARTSVEEIEEVVAVNLLGPAYLATAVLPAMLERRRGSIVNITSVAGYVPTPRESMYGATKAALSHWSHVLAIDLHGTGVHVGVVSPGPIATEIWDKDAEPATYEGKLYPPELVAEAVAESIERERVHLTVPRRFGVVGALYPILQRPMRWGLRRFEERGHAPDVT